MICYHLDEPSWPCKKCKEKVDNWRAKYPFGECKVDGCENPLPEKGRERCEEHFGKPAKNFCIHYDYEIDTMDICDKYTEYGSDYHHIKLCKGVCSEYEEAEFYIGK